MKKLVLALLLSLALPAHAQTVYKLKEGWPGCMTKEGMDEMSQAIIAKDTKWMRSISGCVFFKAGVTGTLDDYGMLSGVSRLWVRPPEGGRAIQLYVNNEAFLR